MTADEPARRRPPRRALGWAFAGVALAAAIVVATILLGARGDGPPIAPAGDCPATPYGRDAPWNRAIGADPSLHPRSDAYVRAIADNDKPLTSDPDQYTPALYAFDDATPRRTVRLSGYFSTYERDDVRKGHGFAPTVTGVPIPDGAVAPPGSDAQVVLWNPSTGVEYGFWRFHRDAKGNVTAENGYRYRTTSAAGGRFADGLAGRGAGLPYLAGLVRRCELDRGRIDHALAFGYDAPSPEHVYPASKSDGDGSAATDVPEGARLQLDPGLGERDFDRWGLPAKARTVARALQRYGMYVVDNSGSSKINLEASVSARWDGSVTRDLVAKIPWSAFRVVRPPPEPDRGGRDTS